MTDLNYQIVRSPKRKKLTITVERDRAVIVHAPEVTSDEAIRRVVDAKRQWRHARNVWHNSMVRSVLQTVAGPFKRMKSQASG